MSHQRKAELEKTLLEQANPSENTGCDVRRSSMLTRASQVADLWIPNEFQDLHFTDQWNADTICLRATVGDFSKTHCLVEESNIPAVLNRISNIADTASCKAMFCSEPAMALLWTMENVVIQVSIAQARENAETVLVETIHHEGDAFRFYKYSRYILEAALGNFGPQDFQILFGPTLSTKYLKQAQDQLEAADANGDRESEQEDSKEEDEDEFAQGMQLVHEQLRNEQMDHKIRGMQCLALFSLPLVVGTSIALLTSRTVLQGIGVPDLLAEIYPEIRDFVIGAIVMDRTLASGNDYYVYFNDATHVLASVLETATVMIEPDSSSTIQEFVTLGSDVLLASLLQGLRNAYYNPHGAAYCATSLRLLRDHIPSTETVQITKEVLELTRHAKLKHECEALLQVLRDD